MSTRDNSDYSEDMFADTRMSFGDHIEELRTHLWRAIVGFVVMLFLSFFIGRPLLEAVIIRPVEEQLQEFYDRQYDKQKEQVLDQIKNDDQMPANQPKFVMVAFPREQLEAAVKGQASPELEKPPDNMPASDMVKLWMRFEEPGRAYANAFSETEKQLRPRPSMKTMNVTEAFVVYFKVCIYSGIVLASPWIFWQIWSFVAAGLYPHEKRLVHFYLPVSLGLFLAGVVACQLVVLPKAIAALLWFNEWLNLDPDLRLNEWLSFAIMFPVFFGLSFQTPLVMMLLNKLGIMEVDHYRDKRRLAYFVLAVVAALGPSIDVFSMMFQWIALCMLYELGIWLCLWSPRTPGLDDLDVPDSEEMVEV